MTLVAGALLGAEAVPNLLFSASYVFNAPFVYSYGTGPLPFLLTSALGLAVGVLLGAALLRQGGVSVPSSRERGATGGAIAGLVLGVLTVVLFGASPAGMLGFFALVGLAVGRTFDAPPRRMS